MTTKPLPVSALFDFGEAIRRMKDSGIRIIGEPEITMIVVPD